jgi:xylulose-5-phosphate/fructose-6-phosphate phosphoketolase
LRILENWLRSYRLQELFDHDGYPALDILALCPEDDKRMAMPTVAG